MKYYLQLLLDYERRGERIDDFTYDLNHSNAYILINYLKTPYHPYHSY